MYNVHVSVCSQCISCWKSISYIVKLMLNLYLLHSCNTYTTIHIYMRKQNQQNDERTHFFRKIYLTLYSKGLRKGCERVMCERWVGDWTDCNILTPSSSVFNSTSFSFCWAAQPGVLRAHPSAGCWFSLQHLISNYEPVYDTGLYNCLTSTRFL